MTNNTQKTSLNTSIIPHLIRTPLQALVAFFILLCFCFGLSLYFSDDVYIHYIFVIFILLYILFFLISLIFNALYIRGDHIDKKWKISIKDAFNKSRKILDKNNKKISADLIKIECGSEKQFEFEINDNKNLLFFKSHILYFHEAGSAPLLQILVNNTVLTTNSLINKPPIQIYLDGRQRKWYDESSESWLLHYSPDFKSNYINPKYKVVNGDPYIFIFNLLHFQDKNNKAKVILKHIGNSFKYSDFKNPIIIEDIKLI